MSENQEITAAVGSNKTSNSEYEINIAHIWRRAIHVKGLPDECFEDLLNYYESICDDEEIYGDKLKIERYEANRHFYFVDKFETLANRNAEPRTALQLVKYGYVVRVNDMNPDEKKLWKEQIKEVLSKELPPRLNEIDVEKIIAEANERFENNESQQDKGEWINLQRGRHVANTERIFEDNTTEAWRWVYDIYWFRYSHIVLTHQTEGADERKNFMYFFTWALILCELEQFDSFLYYHLKENFSNNWDEFGRFLEILKIKHQGKLFNDNLVLLLDRWIKSKPFNISIPESKKTEKAAEEIPIVQPEVATVKQGRKPTEKLEIRKPKLRNPKDSRTILNREDTAKLFNYLAQLNCIFNSDTEISKDSFCKAVQALTGFSAQQLEEYLIYNEKSLVNKLQAKKIIENIKELIAKAIDKKFGGL